jgi:hypothetical protein
MRMFPLPFRNPLFSLSFSLGTQWCKIHFIRVDPEKQCFPTVEEIINNVKEVVAKMLT